MSAHQVVAEQLGFKQLPIHNQKVNEFYVENHNFKPISLEKLPANIDNERDRESEIERVLPGNELSIEAPRKEADGSEPDKNHKIDCFSACSILARFRNSEPATREIGSAREGERGRDTGVGVEKGKGSTLSLSNFIPAKSQSSEDLTGTAYKHLAIRHLRLIHGDSSNDRHDSSTSFYFPSLTDIAVNFTDGMFKGVYNGKQCHLPDIAAVLSRAWSAGVNRIIVTGGSLEESKEALTIAETDGYTVYGSKTILYSWSAPNKMQCWYFFFVNISEYEDDCNYESCNMIQEFDESGDPEKHFQALLSLAKVGVEKGKVVAIGECGLDYDRTHFCSPEIQKKYFERQFEIAHLLKLPMFLHMRVAATDFCDILEQNKHRFHGGVAHSFTGTPEDRDKLLTFNNLFIGINGCSLKTSENLDALKGIPIDRMMIETDSPYCEIKNTHAGKHFIKSTWPSKKKEKYDHDFLVKGRNEPCQIRQVLEVVGGCKGVADINQLSRTFYHNTCRVFFPHDLDSAADALLSESQDSK
ncbi:hypothetical protein LXL04_004836 [Taraxacum kok-saghyz]